MKETPAGDFDYEAQGLGYALQRKTDPRIAAFVEAALGTAKTVVNVGAGAGSYESVDRQFIPIEPSPSMRAQRPIHLAPAIHGVAENLPLDDKSVDAAMAMITVHQWPDLEQGLRELRRVSRGPVIVLTFDGDALARYWLNHYASAVLDVERRRFPAIARICEGFGNATVHAVPIPFDCVDGFGEAFYARPEQFLRREVRASQSAWGFIDASVEAGIVEHLRSDLESGEWDRRFGESRKMPVFNGSLRLIVSKP